MDYEFIEYSKNEYSAIVTLNRPAKLNALTDELLSEIRDAMLKADADKDVRIIILQGAGRAFSAGFDVSPGGKKRETAEDWRAHFHNAASTFRTIWDIGTPVIAKIKGPCLGGGFDMVMACDMAVAAEDSLFGEPEVLFAGTCMFMLIPWLVNLKTCKQILLTGENFDARRALELNLINKVVPVEELDSEVEKLAKKMARIPLGTLPYNKRLINRTYELMNVKEAFALSEDAAVYALAAKSGEALEFDEVAKRDGLKAAFAWRDARFN